MQVLRVNARSWRGTADVYHDFLVALQAPRWHEHDIDAIWESVSSNDVNGVRVPFHVVVNGATDIPEDAWALLSRIDDLFHDLSSTGIPVRLTIHAQRSQTGS